MSPQQALSSKHYFGSHLITALMRPPILCKTDEASSDPFLRTFVVQALLKSHTRKLGDAFKFAVVIQDNWLRTLRISTRAAADS